MWVFRRFEKVTGGKSQVAEVSLAYLHTLTPPLRPTAPAPATHTPSPILTAPTSSSTHVVPLIHSLAYSHQPTWCPLANPCNTSCASFISSQTFLDLCGASHTPNPCCASHISLCTLPNLCSISWTHPFILLCSPETTCRPRACKFLLASMLTCRKLAEIGPTTMIFS